ncbi:MAG: hypothetical protein OXD54_02980 [Candidatus Poribacteria bacterium]|nr:hypothetical protein [Candidatus Poribacteria bacterium]
MQEEQNEDLQEEQNTEEENESPQEAKAIRFVILGIPYSIRPSDELSAEDIEILIAYVKSRVESYTHKGYDETRIPMLVAFDIANELRELQKFYELPITRAIDKLKFVLEPE